MESIETGGDSTESDEIQLEVDEVNDRPVANNEPKEGDTITGDEDTVIVLASLRDNDVDVDNDDLRVELVSTVSKFGGQLSVDSDNAVVYDPSQSSVFQALNKGDVKEDSFTYVVSDGQLNSAVATVSLEIHGVNDAPIVAPDAAEINANNRAVVDVLQNDSDIDGMIDVQSIRIERGAAYGTVTVTNDGIINYRSFGPLRGNDTFFYSVADTDGARSESVSVVIFGNLPPIVEDDIAVTVESTPIMIPVLSNDSDPDGSINSQSVSILSTPDNGTAAVQSDGRVLYTPNEGYVGGDSFQYTVLDDDGRESESANVLVQVNAKSSPMQNPSNRFDVNADGVVTPVDPLRILNKLAMSDGDTIPVPEDPVVPDYLDVNGDERISISDVLAVLDELSRRDSESGEGEESTELAPLAEWYASGNVIHISAGSIQSEDLAASKKIVLPNCLPRVKEEVIDLLAADQDGDSEEEEFELIDEALADIF